MDTYEIKVRVTISKHSVNSIIGCNFWFKNPIIKEDSLIAEYNKNGESTMDFIKRIKEYINSNELLIRIRNKINEDVKAYEEENRLEKDFEEVKKALDGLTFKVKVDID